MGANTKNRPLIWRDNKYNVSIVRVLMSVDDLSSSLVKLDAPVFEFENNKYVIESIGGP